MESHLSQPPATASIDATAAAAAPRRTRRSWKSLFLPCLLISGVDDDDDDDEASFFGQCFLIVQRRLLFSHLLLLLFFFPGEIMGNRLRRQWMLDPSLQLISLPPTSCLPDPPLTHAVCWKSLFLLSSSNLASCCFIWGNSVSVDFLIFSPFFAPTLSSSWLELSGEMIDTISSSGFSSSSSSFFPLAITRNGGESSLFAALLFFAIWRRRHRP